MSEPRTTPPQASDVADAGQGLTSGISEVALPVSELKRGIAFYREALGFLLEMESEDGAFLLPGGPGTQRVILLTRSYLESARARAASFAPDVHYGHVHFAFRVERTKLEGALARLRAHGVEISEPARFEAPMHAVSYYFRDPDGHLLEFWSPEPD